VTSGGLPCDHANNAYAASWITGVTRDAARPSDVLISFNNYCVQGGGSFLAEALGLAQYAPATHTLKSQVTVFTSTSGTAVAKQERLGLPIVSGRYLYLFASHCNETYDVACISNSGNTVYLAGQREAVGLGYLPPAAIAGMRARHRGRRALGQRYRSSQRPGRYRSLSATSPPSGTGWC
jgi:hypothetical protein